MSGPYYADEWVTIYHGDCADVLPYLADVDLVLTSPPYNLGQANAVGRKEWTRLAGGYDTHADDMPHADYVAWQQDVLRLCWATLSPAGAIYYQHKPLVRGNEVTLPFELNPGLPLRQIITWDRGSGFNRNLTHYVPRYEWILILARPEFRITTRDVDDLWRINARPSAHPAPFPLSLARRAIDTTAAALVVDPFMGSGTTLRAAKDCGRRAIGIEKSELYCEMAANRLAQGSLTFDSKVAQ